MSLKEKKAQMKQCLLRARLAAAFSRGDEAVCRQLSRQMDQWMLRKMRRIK